MILSAPSGIRVDHKDGNGLNNRRNNIRLCTQSQNGFNRDKSKNNTSGHKGVFWNRQTNRWRAIICINRKNIHLGYFREQADAIKAYKDAAEYYHGDFSFFKRKRRTSR